MHFHEYIYGQYVPLQPMSPSCCLPTGADPFGGDPFKGSDPFAADSFFSHTSKAAFPAQDPFSASADPFGTTVGAPEPDLFAAKPNEAAATAAAAPDPFAARQKDPPSTAKDPFVTSGGNGADSDLFGQKMNPAAEKDPFGSQDGSSDPFSASAPGSEPPATVSSWSHTAPLVHVSLMVWFC